MSKTKIVIFQKREIIYTSILIFLGVIIVILLCILLGGKNKSQQTATAQNTYHAGTYSSEIELGGQFLNMEVIIDTEKIKSVNLTNLNESVTTMYPLISPSLDNINKALDKGFKPDEIEPSDDNKYTEMMLIEKINEIVSQAKTN